MGHSAHPSGSAVARWERMTTPLDRLLGRLGTLSGAEILAIAAALRDGTASADGEMALTVIP